MSSRREFEIAFVGLKPGIHEFSYRITDRFFEAYQQQDFRHCDAQVKLTLIQVEKNDSRSGRGPTPAQNPTTRATAGLGAHTVRDGDTLQSIAYTRYGDPTAWRTIAEANRIDDPMSLRRGTRLSIPALDA